MHVFDVFNGYARDYCVQTSWLRFVMCFLMCLGTDALNNDMSHYATRHVALKLMYLGARYAGRSLVKFEHLLWSLNLQIVIWTYKVLEIFAVWRLLLLMRAYEGLCFVKYLAMHSWCRQ